MTQNVKEEDFKRFINHLDESAGAVFRTAKYFYNKGIPATIQPMKKAKSYKERMKYTDDGDLMISQRIEVKGLSCSFTGRDDWKFGNKLIVCARHSWDLASPKPYAYMLWNKERTHVAIIYGNTRPHWTVAKVRDKRYQNVEQEMYFCSLDHVIWEKFNDDEGM